MNGAFYIAATGLRAQQDALEVVANNVSNINTAGFKRSEARFATLVGAQALAGADPLTAIAGQGLAGVSVQPSLQDFAQGEIRQTGRTMDLAIKGDGFIELIGADAETRLWRGGGLTINPDGFLAADNGMALKAAISVPSGATDLAISPDGKVSANVDGTLTELGKIEVALPKSMASLAPMGDGLYRVEADADLTAAAGGEEGAGLLVQGAVESSNVQLSQEMVLLLMMQRAYAANAQVVQAGDQLMSIANNLRR